MQGSCILLGGPTSDQSVKEPRKEEKVGEGRGGPLRPPLSFLAEETEPLHVGSGSALPTLPLVTISLLPASLTLFLLRD